MDLGCNYYFLFKSVQILLLGWGRGEGDLLAGSLLGLIESVCFQNYSGARKSRIGVWGRGRKVEPTRMAELTTVNDHIDARSLLNTSCLIDAKIKLLF